MDDDPDFEKAKKKAFRLLARRARSEKELRDKLREKKFEGGLIDRVVSRLFELNYLDDEAFSRQWVRHLAVDKLSGNCLIEASLRKKGISKDPFKLRIVTCHLTKLNYRFFSHVDY